MRYMFIVKSSQNAEPTPKLMEAMHKMAQREPTGIRNCNRDIQSSQLGDLLIVQNQRRHDRSFSGMGW